MFLPSFKRHNGLHYVPKTNLYNVFHPNNMLESNNLTKQLGFNIVKFLNFKNNSKGR